MCYHLKIDNMNSSYAEHEVKYVTSCIRANEALFWLNKTCKPDPLYPRSIVNSIYFDTLDFKALNEKINSDFIKTKFRIRWYENIGDNYQNHEFACLERIERSVNNIGRLMLGVRFSMIICCFLHITGRLFGRRQR